MSELPDIPEVVEDAISDLISAVCDREHGPLRRAAIDQGNVEKARDELARLFAEALQATKPDAVALERASFSPVTVLPDGSAFATASFPLPKDHWLYKADADGFTAPPPMPWRMGTGDERNAVADKIRAAARYAVQASTMRGQDEDFDPDAMVQNMVVGMLGYWTPDGLSSDAWANPAEVPPLSRSQP